MLIQDIRPPYKPETPPPEVMEMARRSEAEHNVKTMPQDIMITELFKRGVTIEDIFGQFYALEAMADARHDEMFGNDEDGQHGKNAKPITVTVTVGDARLAGYGLPVVDRKQPF